MENRPTIKDIAKLAGVTHSTVSRVIHDSPLISQETKIRVMEILKSVNYQPNLIARSLVSKKTRAFALITPELNPHVLPIIRGVTDTCKRLNYGLMLFSTDYWSDENKSYVEVAGNWLVDGVLIYNIVYHENITEEIKKLQRGNIPFIFINKYLGTKKVNTVSVDNYDASYKAVFHLFNLGHKRIGMINGSIMSVDGHERFEGYKLALKKLNLELNENWIGYANFREDEAFEEMKKILCSSRRPTAVFCASDLMATGAVKAIQMKRLRIPKDIAVVGFDDWEGGLHFKPSLTTLRAPLEDIGGHAIRLLMKAIENPKSKAEEVSLKARLIVRESTMG